MKRLFIIVLSLFTLSANSQARLGSTIGDIYSEFKDDGITVGTTDDGDKYAAMLLGNYLVTYFFFDKSQTCNATFIEPKTQGSLNSLVEIYNKQYVIVNNNSWRMYSQNGNVANITLFIPENGKATFMWSSQ
jgi:hypothetical protein